MFQPLLWHAARGGLLPRIISVWRCRRGVIVIHCLGCKSAVPPLPCIQCFSFRHAALQVVSVLACWTCSSVRPVGSVSVDSLCWTNTSLMKLLMSGLGPCRERLLESRCSTPGCLYDSPCGTKKPLGPAAHPAASGTDVHAQSSPVIKLCICKTFGTGSPSEARQDALVQLCHRSGGKRKRM